MASGSRRLYLWLLAALVAFFLFAASAPSPLYSIYARMYRFSPTTVTVIYAVYAAGALGALLITGRLSDHLGRRPVVLGALVIQIVGMLAFIRAEDVGALYLGRVLQGIGTGIATGAIGAWLLDLEPPERPGRGSLLGGIMPLAGLAGGALVSSLLVQYAPDPLHLVFWALVAVYATAFVVVLVAPDVIETSAGWARSLRPQIGVPAAARAQFVSSTPTLIAIWALAGLYLSLGPALATSLAATDNRVVGGLVIFLLCGGGAITSGLVQAIEPRRLVINGSLIVVAGVGITLLAVLISSTILLYAGSLLTGLGFGPAFSGIVRSLGPLAPPEKRGALFSAVLLVVYFSISIPAIGGGIAVSHYGLRNTTYAYGLAVMALAGITYVAVSRRRPSAVAG